MVTHNMLVVEPRLTMARRAPARDTAGVCASDPTLVRQVHVPTPVKPLRLARVRTESHLR